MTLLKPRTTAIVIYQGDDLERLAELHRAAVVAERQAQEALDAALSNARRGAALREGDEDPEAAIAQARVVFNEAVQPTRDAYDAFVTEAADRAVEVRLTAIGSTRFAELVLRHQPRTVEVDGETQTHPDDAPWSVDVTTFPKALLAYRDDVKRTIVSPELSEGGLATFLDDECATGDIDRLWVTAYEMNRTPGRDPKDSRFSDSFPS